MFMVNKRFIYYGDRVSARQSSQQNPVSTKVVVDHTMFHGVLPIVLANFLFRFRSVDLDLRSTFVPRGFRTDGQPPVSSFWARRWRCICPFLARVVVVCRRRSRADR